MLAVDVVRSGVSKDCAREEFHPQAVSTLARQCSWQGWCRLDDKPKLPLDNVGPVDPASKAEPGEGARPRPVPVAVRRPARHHNVVDGANKPRPHQVLPTRGLVRGKATHHCRVRSDRGGQWDGDPRSGVDGYWWRLDPGARSTEHCDDRWLPRSSQAPKFSEVQGLGGGGCASDAGSGSVGSPVHAVVRVDHDPHCCNAQPSSSSVHGHPAGPACTAPD